MYVGKRSAKFSKISPPHLNATYLISFKKPVSCIVIILLYDKDYDILYNRMYSKLIKSNTKRGVARCHLLKIVKIHLAFSKP